MSNKKPNPKKTSTTAIAVILVTIIIAVIAGTSDAAALEAAKCMICQVGE